MSICTLCKENTADKKGSHIVPHFLLKRIENIEGRTGRDYELGFAIGAFDTTSHFGRSVPPEKLEDVFGEIADSDIEGNKHPLIVDNFFCTYCEGRFAKVESEYAKTLSSTNNEVYSSGIKAGFALLFWSSVLWRISVNGKSGVRLTNNQNEILRRILDRSLSDDLTEIPIEKLREAKDANKLSYKLIRCPNYSEENVTHMLFHPKFRYPYSLLIDEYLLLFSFTNNYNDYLNKDFFGLQEEVIEAPINGLEGEELIYPIGHEKMASLNEGIVDHIKSIRVQNLYSYWDKLHRAIGGRGNQMPENIKKELLAELTSDEKKLGRKNNMEDLRQTTIKVVQKYYYGRSNGRG